MKRRPLALLAVAAASLIALTGCAAETPTPTASASATPADTPAAPAFPRTVTIPAGAAGPETTVTIDAQPVRIATLSYETTALAAELGLAENVVLMPKEASAAALSDHADAFVDVEATFPTVSKIDPEEVIAAAPDLVLMTARHGVEDTTGTVIAQAGIPVIVLPNSWATVDDVTADVTLVGEATGTEEAAATLVSDLKAGLTDKAATVTEHSPRILVLSNQAGRAFVTAGSAFPLDMLTLAGGVDASSDLGIRATGPITAEQIVQANPDGILLVDMNGSGERLFADVLTNEAVAALPGAANTHLVEGKDVQALGLRSTIPGLTDLTTWVTSLK